MKSKLERFALGLILAPLTPLAGLLGFWWIAYTLLPEGWIPYAVAAGLLIGVLADFFLVEKLLDRRLGLPFWMAAFLFYSLVTFSFSMGVPVLNTALAIPAGFVIGCRLASENADRQRVRKTGQRTAWFTTGVLALVCAASAFIALISKSTASDLQGMLGLGFTVTQGMIVGLILVGGLMLLAACWVLSIAAVRFTYLFMRRRNSGHPVTGQQELLP